MLCRYWTVVGTCRPGELARADAHSVSTSGPRLHLPRPSVPIVRAPVVRRRCTSWGAPGTTGPRPTLEVEDVAGPELRRAQVVDGDAEQAQRHRAPVEAQIRQAEQQEGVRIGVGEVAHAKLV